MSVCRRFASIRSIRLDLVLAPYINLGLSFELSVSSLELFILHDHESDFHHSMRIATSPSEMITGKGTGSCATAEELGL